MNSRSRFVEGRSTLTCPRCGRRATETMPSDACQYFYDCAGCGALLAPRAGDCCVFCSYGDVACPPVQARGAGADNEGDPMP
ncbi:MAG TPA: GDCCVxC domain-containing (seleno)protein [Caulobacteraceae bacterium]|nr:GDCCVxC domain-containing (seleno)protein [Caulobacteraceae bacterium]